MHLIFIHIVVVSFDDSATRSKFRIQDLMKMGASPMRQGLASRIFDLSSSRRPKTTKKSSDRSSIIQIPKNIPKANILKLMQSSQVDAFNSFYKLWKRTFRNKISPYNNTPRIISQMVLSKPSSSTLEKTARILHII